MKSSNSRSRVTSPRVPAKILRELARLIDRLSPAKRAQIRRIVEKACRRDLSVPRRRGPPTSHRRRRAS
jgi:hypothetical protein